MSPDSIMINLKYDLFKLTFNRVSWDSRFRNILFAFRAKVQNVLPVKNSSVFSFFNILQRKCPLSLPDILLINDVTNRYISNTLSAYN